MKRVTSGSRGYLLTQQRGLTTQNIELTYQENEPHQVSIQVGEATWVTSRELIEAGTRAALGETVGEGSLQVTKARQILYLSRETTQGPTQIILSRAAVLEFLHHTYQMVPAGSEQQEVSDADLIALLES